MAFRSDCRKKTGQFSACIIKRGANRKTFRKKIGWNPINYWGVRNGEKGNAELKDFNKYVKTKNKNTDNQGANAKQSNKSAQKIIPKRVEFYNFFHFKEPRLCIF